MNVRRLYPRSLRLRIALVVFGAGTIVVAIMATQTADTTETRVQDEYRAADELVMELAVAVSRPALLAVDYAELQSVLNSIAESPRVVRIDVLDRNAVTVASSHMGRTPTAAERDGATHDLTRVVTTESGEVGAVRVEFSDAGFDEAIAQGASRGLIVGLLGIGVVAVLAIITSHTLTRPLARVMAQMGELDENGVPLPVDVPEGGEVGALADSLNRRTLDIRSRLEQVQATGDELARTQQRLEAALETAVDGMIDLDLPNRVVRVFGTPFSSGGLEGESHDLSEFVGQVHPDDMAEVVNVVEDRRAQGITFFELDMRFRASPDAWNWYTCRGRLRYDGDELVQILATIVDITRRRELERELTHADKMRSLGQLVSGLMHDLNNILAVARLNVEMLLDEGRDERRDAIAVEQVGKAVDQAADLLDSLLGLVHIGTAQPSVVDMNELVHTVGQSLDTLVGPNVEIQLITAAPRATVRIDRSRAEQILLNLGTNARDAVQGKGVIAFTTTVVEVVDHPALEPGRYLELAVRDNGTGIEEDIAETLFDPFVTTKPLGVGTGLGLATSLDTVQHAGGSIEAQNNQPGPGATVTVRLPLTEEPVTATPPATNHRPVDAASGTVLVVDDETGLLEVIGDTLRGAGYDVFLAVDGEEAAAIAGDLDRVDLLLTDLLMPGEDGGQVATAVRRAHPSAAIVYMTAQRGIGDRAASTPDGPTLGKPFSVSSLLEVVAEQLHAEPTAERALHDGD